MDIKEILSKCDHTLLSPAATWDEIRALCDDAIEFGCASVCIPGSFVKQAKEYVGERLRICTVVGFPNGNCFTAVKAYEAFCAVHNGADEIDMVINIGWLKEKRYNDVRVDINCVKCNCFGRPVKVIVETCLLTEEEKIKACEIVSASDAQYIKTSTGFSTGGATLADVELFAKHVTNGTLIKAAGGISSLADAEAFINAGASRLGTSKIVKIAKNEKIGGGY